MLVVYCNCLGLVVIYGSSKREHFRHNTHAHKLSNYDELLTVDTGLGTFLFLQVRMDIYRAKLELMFELNRMPTDDEIIERVGISPERHHEVTRASKPVFSLHTRHSITQEEFINGITDVDGVGGDKRRQPALLRLALDDVVITYTL